MPHPPRARPIGEFELLVLLAVLQAGDDAYGVTIGLLLDERAGRRLSRGSLYLTLERLVDKGWLRTRTVEGTSGRGGHARKYYRVSPSGIAAIKQARDAVRGLWQGLEGILGKP